VGSVWLGFCVRGVVVFNVHRDVKTATQHCAWRKTSNISCAQRKFVIELQDHSDPLVFYTSSSGRARYLLELSKACHKFHLVWAKKKAHSLSHKTPSSAGPVSAKQTTPPEVTVEYPSLSRPVSVVEDMTSSSTVPAVTMETVTVTLNRGVAESFGFSIAVSVSASHEARCKCTL
jgi:hypothetical protein